MLGRNMVAWFADMGEACALPPEISAFLIDREPLLPCRVSLRPPPAGLTWLKPCMAASPCQSSQIFPAIPFTVSRSILCEAWDYFRAHLDMRHYGTNILDRAIAYGIDPSGFSILPHPYHFAPITTCRAYLKSHAQRSRLDVMLPWTVVSCFSI